MRVLLALGLLGGTVPEENYDFVSATDDRCVSKIGIGIEAKYKADCDLMAEPRRYRGTWYVDFETSFFTPAGKQDCMQTDEPGDCLELAGEALPWPPRSDCGRKFELEFIGRRNVYRKFFPRYSITVDKLISARRLPDPYDVDCDPNLPPELKTKE